MSVSRASLAVLALSVVNSGCSPASTSAAPPAQEALGGAREPGDPRIQRIAGEEIDRAVGQWGAVRGVVVVIDPTNGAVLAMDGRDHGRAEPSLGSTRAWVTGSTLKPITIAAAIDRGLITLEQRFPCGVRPYGAEELHDAKEGPCAPLDARGIVGQSSNVGTAYVFDALGSARLTESLRALHVGDAPGVLPVIDDDKSFRAGMFAGGEVAEATPLQMALAYGAIFNGGVYPRTGARVLKAETAKALVAMLENVVGGDGNASGARVAGARAAGKTGTADVKDEGKEMYYVSFIGTVLDREPRFVALVGLEVPAGEATGPSAAAPAWGKLAARIIAER